MSIIESIQTIKNFGGFKKYINYIQFPLYKNLEANTRIEFNYPLTVLIGKNGCGKSSTLYALFGTPRGHSTGTFWFSTETDPIRETGVEDERYRYFYGYTESKHSELKEVLKQRAPREGNPEYWETARPVKAIGMTSDKRNAPVDKNVLYLDFRGEISAFDKYFYFGQPQKEKTQDFLRRKSKYLSRAFERKDIRYPGAPTKMQEDILELPENELKEISKILSKEYESILLLKHRYYDKWGVSVLMKSKYDFNYTEANAGSGEIAVIQLVHQVLTADEYSLILLDEPEVSLHPCAQTRIQNFLLEQIKKHKHQVIISTHSPAIIKGLPNSAIKLFTLNTHGKFHVSENVDYREAFYELENYVENKKMIICEDMDAQKLIQRTLCTLNLDKHFIVQFVHGGADTIINHLVPTYAMNTEFKDDIFIILDGDKYCESIDSNQLTHTDRNSPEILQKSIKRVFSGNDVKPYVDGGNNGGRPDQKCECYIKYLDFHKHNIGYLPNKKIPEQIVLSSNYVKARYNDVINGYDEITVSNAKKILLDISKLRQDEDIINTFEALAYELFHDEYTDDTDKLKELLSNIFKNSEIEVRKL